MKNQLKERLKKGESVLGTWNGIPSPTVVNAIGLSGIDFVVIDTEHGPYSMETAENSIRAAEVAGCSPVIRVSTNEANLILRALDIGAHGVQVPHVSSKEDAVAAVNSAKYHPAGERGFTPFTRAGKYGLNAKNHAKDANDQTLVVVHVEGTEGVKNLKDIASVKGIDVLFIGPYDLSQSLGKPGEVEDPQVIAAIRSAVKIAQSKGIACGAYARDEKYLDILIDCGVQYLTYLVDSAVIVQAYKKVYERFQDKKK